MSELKRKISKKQSFEDISNSRTSQSYDIESEVFSERHYFSEELESHGRKSLRFKKPSHLFRRIGGMVGRGPKGYVRSDELIYNDACDSLYRCTDVDASNIEVQVKKGVIFLKGFVQSREQKKMAEYHVESLAGVSDVFNELRVTQEEQLIKKSKWGLIDNITGLN